MIYQNTILLIENYITPFQYQLQHENNFLMEIQTGVELITKILCFLRQNDEFDTCFFDSFLKRSKSSERYKFDYSPYVIFLDIGDLVRF